MEMRILELDGSLNAQAALLARTAAPVIPLHEWAPRIRLACRFAQFERFQSALDERLGVAADDRPQLTWYGSGDFHHVSLALLRRLRTPFNLLVIDNHPDWMRGVPFLHCGTWLWHAARLPLARHIFHVGGDVDFDNYYRWMAPWPLLRSGRITVFPAVRRYQRGMWSDVPAPPLRLQADASLEPDRIEELVWPYRDELARCPLYISLDKDVLTAEEAVVNWDSGHLHVSEVEQLLTTFVAAADGNMAGMDIVGDWSPVRVHGALRRMLHLTEHPPLQVDPARAAWRNERLNLRLLEQVPALVAKRPWMPLAA
jgi:hypothetical protein